MADTVRYWDGDVWTEHRAPSSKGHAVEADLPPVMRRGDMSIGYVLAFFFPIGGLIYGIAKIRSGGEKVIAAALAFQVVYLVVFFVLWGA